MSNLLYDMSSFRLAPTLGREAAASGVGFVLVMVAALLLVEDPVLKVVIPAAFLAYALVRALLLARAPRDARR